MKAGIPPNCLWTCKVVQDFQDGPGSSRKNVTILFENMKKLLLATNAEKAQWLMEDLNDVEEELEVPPSESLSSAVRRMGAALVRNRLRKVATRRWFQATRQLTRMVRIWTAMKVTKMERAADKKKELEHDPEKNELPK